MANERNIVDEQILYALIAARREDAQADLVEKVEVNEEYCMAVGMFNYRDMRTGQRVNSRLYFIAETVDGEPRNIIYDELGRPIAWQDPEEDMVLQVAGDVKLDRDLLKKQLVLAEERAREGLPAPEMDEKGKSKGSKSGENKSGEGRDLAEKEHEKTEEEQNQEEGTKKEEEQTEEREEQEEEEQEQEEEEEQEQEGQGEKKEQLRNLHYKINVGRNPKICLNEIINGYYLWDILGLDDKLAGRLPDGLDPTAFRSGFLTFADSSELDSLDAQELPQDQLKPRKSQDTLIIQTLSGDMFELDEKILKSKELGTQEEKQKAERSNLRFENGEEAETPETSMATTRTSLFEIPDVTKRFAVGENWYLGVDYDESYKRTGEIPAGGHTKNLSFVQVSTKESYYNREERIQHTLETKLYSIDEPAPSAKELRGLREKNANEAEMVRDKHMDRLVRECFGIYPQLKDYYNYNDIRRMVEEEHNEGKDHDEIIEDVGELVQDAERREHTRPLPGEDKRRF